MLKKIKETISKEFCPLVISAACLLFLLAVLTPVMPVSMPENETIVSEETLSETGLTDGIEPFHDREPEKIKPK